MIFLIFYKSEKGGDWKDIKTDVSERSHHWLKVALT